MQAWTDQSSTQIVLSIPQHEDFKVTLIAPQDRRPISPKKQHVFRRPGSQWALLHVYFSGLESDSSYQLNVVDQRGQVRDQRQLALVKKSLSEKLKLAVVSCMRDDYERSELLQIWQSLISQKPDVLFMIGDNTYADLGIKAQLSGVDPDLLWQRHMETRRRLPIFRTPQLIPVFSVWDDHDYGKNDGGAEYAHRNQSQQIFRQFFPMGTMDFEQRGVAQSLRLGGQQFLFLDNRSFRAPKKDSGLHFGPSQTRWLMDQITNANGITWLISGDQFFGAYHPFESFAGSHPQDFKKFKHSLRSTGKRVLFLSGDRHLSEITQVPETELGYKTYEITSSPIHSTTYPGAGDRHKNPWQLEGVDGVWNYVIINSFLQSDQLKLEVTSHDKEGVPLFHAPLTIPLNSPVPSKKIKN
jgi:alkaline phosphatase D